MMEKLRKHLSKFLIRCKMLWQKFKGSSQRTKVLVSIIILLLLITFVGGTYALLSSSFEKKNTFTITTGTLTYELASSGLNENRQVLVPKNGMVEVDLTITSLNEIDSTYLIYYEGGNSLIVAGYYNNGVYSGQADIVKHGKQNITVSFSNHSDSDVTITVGIQGGLYQKELVLAQGVAITSEITGDIVSSWRYVGDGVVPDHFPNKGEGYQVTEVVCNHGTGSWNASAWKLLVKDIEGNGASCVITFDDQEIYFDDSGANPPELIEGLIPVTWSGSDWVKADTSTEWYDYDKQMWANAVTVTSASRDSYNSASANTVISMDDIETMWVWIPRYSYTIGNTYGVQGYGGSTPSKSTPGAIDIKFVDSNTKDVGSAKYTGNTPSGWRTPDGFTFGDQELSGFWMAKFEASSSNPSAESGGGDVTTLELFVKPDVVSWRAITMSTQFTVSRKLTSVGNRYGLSTSADSHIVKTSEWGAVAYLSQSKYGKYGNTDYSGTNKEVYKNNSSSYYTGRSLGHAPASNNDDTANGSYIYSTSGSGTGASTTGTIYGVYDMSGGSYDYTMGNYNHTIGSSGFSTLPDHKYYDIYTTTTASTACDGEICYGHALSETAGWYSDNQAMVSSSSPWIQRGGSNSHTTNAGIFGIYSTIGVGGSASSIRLVLVSEN